MRTDWLQREPARPDGASRAAQRVGSERSRTGCTRGARSASCEALEPRRRGLCTFPGFQQLPRRPGDAESAARWRAWAARAAVSQRRAKPARKTLRMKTIRASKVGRHAFALRVQLVAALAADGGFPATTFTPEGRVDARTAALASPRECSPYPLGEGVRRGDPCCHSLCFTSPAGGRPLVVDGAARVAEPRHTLGWGRAARRPRSWCKRALRRRWTRWHTPAPVSSWPATTRGKPWAPTRSTSQVCSRAGRLSEAERERITQTSVRGIARPMLEVLLVREATSRVPSACAERGAPRADRPVV